MPTKPPRSLAVVVLAAGLGKRLKSTKPKVLHELLGRPVLWYVLQAVRAAKPSKLIVVVHHDREEVEEAVRSWDLGGLKPAFVDQGQPLGTGHAVLAAEQAVGRAADVLVLPGDEPLVTGEQVKEILAIHRRRDVAAVIQTTVPTNARGFARVVRDAKGEFVRLAEGSDATRQELAIAEVATSVYTFRRDALFAALPLVDRDNRQREYYLPDVLGILRRKDRIAVQLVDNGGSVGANSRAEMAIAASVLRDRINAKHMAAGVSLVDPSSTFIGPEVRIGADTVLQPLTFLEGGTRIGREAEIGPSARVIDSTVGDRSRVQFAVVRESTIAADVDVGPFASLRPGTELADGSKAGTFVEIKGSRVGKGSKVPHLSYIGDADIGQGVNVGAATVTVNYDGWDKHRTVIGDDVKIGSDTMLVAPVEVGKGAITGAGSVITKDVPAGALGIERSDQRNIEGFRSRQESRHRTRGGSSKPKSKSKGEG